MVYSDWFDFKDKSDLKEKFKSPPREYSMLPFWSWNHTLDPDKIRFQIDEMVDKGVYGAFIHARAGIEDSNTPYFSDGWWKAIKAAVEHGTEKGFYTILYDEDKWPSGAAGGRVVETNPKFRKSGLKVKKWELSGPGEIKLDFKGDLIAVLAARLTSPENIDPKSIIDISKKSGEPWKVPEGQWSIMAFTKLTDTGIQIDYLNKEAVAKFIEITHEEYFRRFSKYFGNTIPGIFFDEIYAHLRDADFVWSRNFLEDFKSIKGYDLKPLLPCLVYNAGDLTPKVRCDYFDVFTKLYTEAWFKQIYEWCESHAIWLVGHTLETLRDYKSQGSYFRQWAPVQIPGTDNEDYRYTFPRRIRWFKPKQHSSLCHLYGKKRAAVEALGGGGWVVAPEEYKIGFYMLGVYGLNLFIPHLFHYSIDNPRALEDWPPSWFYRNPYWKYFEKLADLSSRISFMNSQGSHVCDVCVLYPITTLWAQNTEKKEDVGTLGGGETGNLLEVQYNAIQEALLDNLFDYDIIDPESIIQSDCSENKIKTAHESYSVLILPPVTTIRRDVIEKIKTFFDNGGTVIALNTLPTASMEKGENHGFVLNTCKEIFGFDPRSIRIGYFEIDSKFEKEYTVNTNINGGRAYFTKWTKYIPEILSERTNKDVIVVQGDPALLHVSHRRIGEKEIYFLVNEKKTIKNLRVSFRDGGKPEIWNPETGDIKKISNYMTVNGRTEIPLTFRPWEGYYIVFSPTKEKHTTFITHTNLHDTRITKIKDNNKINIQGWRKGDEEKISITLEKRKSDEIQLIQKEIKAETQLSSISLNGKWKFIPAPKELDNQWIPEINSSEIEVPVFKFRHERERENGESLGWHQTDFEDTDWKLIKIKDDFNKDKACKRYLSVWDASWINYYRYEKHWGTLGGKIVDFRRELTIEKEIDSAWICITADQSYEFSINSKKVGKGSDWKNPDVYDISSFLNKGKNELLITVSECKGLLLQGKIKLKNSREIQLMSNDKWEASVDRGVWLPAYPYIYPPLGPWGEIPMNRKQITFPVTFWYRQELPAGTNAIKMPVISGKYQIFVNNKEIHTASNAEKTNISEFLRHGKNILAIKVTASTYNNGILEPVSIVCKPDEVTLSSWTEQGLYWYSGRAVYSKEFDLPPLYLESDKRLILDLGDVRYCAEIWINNKLVDYKPWPPYSADITNFVLVGKNKISVVAANLLANQRQWEIYDESLTNLRSRFVHHGAVFREPDKLESGLIGPVTLIPYQKEKIDLF